MADGRCPDMSAVDMLKLSQKGTALYGAYADFGVRAHIGATWRI